MSKDELIGRLESRLAFVNEKIDFYKKDLGDRINHNHYMGYLEAADGTVGERQFLEKLITEIKGD